MKLLTSLLFTLIAVSPALADGEKIVLEGIYQSKNIYVTNCYGQDGIGFSVSAVRVNGEITSDQVQSSAFEIDLSQFNFAQGDEITIQIEYDGPCKPKVLNPGALQPIPTFDVSDIQISKEGLLSWTTINEQGKLPYSVEQFKWNKWVKIGEVDGIGTPESHNYQFQTTLVSGQNKFRVVQKNLNGDTRAGKQVAITTQQEQPTFKYDKKASVVRFTKETSYEVYDMYGQIRKRGFGKEIDFSNLEKGDYYMNFDNTMEKFPKR